MKNVGYKFDDESLSKLLKAVTTSMTTLMFGEGDRQDSVAIPLIRVLRAGLWSSTKVMDSNITKVVRAGIRLGQDKTGDPTQVHQVANRVLTRVIQEVLPDLPSTPADIRGSLRHCDVVEAKGTLAMAAVFILLGAAECRLGPGSPEVRAKAADAVLILGCTIIVEEFERVPKTAKALTPPPTP